MSRGDARILRVSRKFVSCVAPVQPGVYTAPPDVEPCCLGAGAGARVLSDQHSTARIRTAKRGRTGSLLNTQLYAQTYTSVYKQCLLLLPGECHLGVRDVSLLFDHSK